MKKTVLLYLMTLPALALADDALQACQKALAAGNFAQAAQTGQHATGFDGAMCKGKAQLAMNDFTNAATAFSEAENSAKEPFDKMLAITFLARASQGAGKTDEALGQYERSLMLAQQTKQNQALMIDLNEIGQLIQSKGETKEALERFLQAAPYAANDNERSECSQLIASAYSQLGDHDKAIEYQLKSVLMEERSGDADHYLNAKLELAAISTAAKDYPRAQKELDESLKISQNAGSEYWQARTMLYQSRLERARGNGEQAKTLLKNALDISNKIGAESLAGQISTELKQ